MPLKSGGVSKTISCQAIFAHLTAAFVNLQAFRKLRPDQIVSHEI